MRSSDLLVVAMVLSFSACDCGGDDDGAAGAPGNGTAGMAGGNAAGAGSGAAGAAGGAETESVALLRTWITAYDREVAALCPCLVELDAFASNDECMAANGSGPTWLPCVSAVAEEVGAASLIADARCMVEQRTARATCVEAAACDDAARDACYEQAMDAGTSCPPIDNELVLLVLQRCPDLALLSR